MARMKQVVMITRLRHGSGVSLLRTEIVEVPVDLATRAELDLKASLVEDAIREQQRFEEACLRADENDDIEEML